MPVKPSVPSLGLRHYPMSIGLQSSARIHGLLRQHSICAIHPQTDTIFIESCRTFGAREREQDRARLPAVPEIFWTTVISAAQLTHKPAAAKSGTRSRPFTTKHRYDSKVKRFSAAGDRDRTFSGATSRLALSVRGSHAVACDGPLNCLQRWNRFRWASPTVWRQREISMKPNGDAADDDY